MRLILRPLVLALLAACGGSAAAPTPAKEAPAKEAPAKEAPAKEAPAPAAPAAPAVQRIATGAGVRVRQSADAAAPEVGRLAIGDVAAELEIGPTATIGGKTEPWVKLRLPDGKEGWAFGGFVQKVEGDAKAVLDARWKVVRDRLAATTPIPAAELAEIADAIGRMRTGAEGELALRLEFAQLDALRRYGEAITPEVMGGELPAPTKAFLKRWEDANVMFYNEIGGNWIVSGNTLDALATKAKGTPVAEDVLWAIATWPVGGECEGDPMCVLGSYLTAEGRYLEAFPTGAHVADALGSITRGLEYVEKDAEVPTDAPSRADVRKNVAELRAAIAKVTHPDKSKLVARLDAIDKRFK